MWRPTAVGRGQNAANCARRREPQFDELISDKFYVTSSQLAAEQLLNRPFNLRFTTFLNLAIGFLLCGYRLKSDFGAANEDINRKAGVFAQV
jgi:hypothetical protein